MVTAVASPVSVSAACLTLIVGLTGAARASENFSLRYAPSSGGGDLSAPLEPGQYFQLPSATRRAEIETLTTVSLASSQLFSGSLSSLAQAFPSAYANTEVRTRVVTRTEAFLPRWTYMSDELWLGGAIGVTAMVPLIHQRVRSSSRVGETAIAGVDLATLQRLGLGATALGQITDAANGSVRDAAAAQDAALSDERLGMGDLEVAPVLCWRDGDLQWLLAPTLVLPTGEYDKTSSASPGAGNYYSFRPSLQVGYIGDGWDFGTRVAFTVNSRNRDTGYRSGNELSVDLSAMYLLTNEWRIGLAGYASAQTTRDQINRVPDDRQAVTVGRRGRVFGVGPGVTWTATDGELMLDMHLVKDFGAVHRTEGAMVWVTLSMALQ